MCCVDAYGASTGKKSKERRLYQRFVALNSAVDQRVENAANSPTKDTHVEGSRSPAETGYHPRDEDRTNSPSEVVERVEKCERLSPCLW
jgi:hypothetical protein